jgi:proteasome assembly chaperone (PAC2) family protein
VFDPEAAKRILDKLCAAADVEVRLDTQIIAAHRDEGRIASLQVVDHAGAHELTADAFVDASWPTA